MQRCTSSLYTLTLKGALLTHNRTPYYYLYLLKCDIIKTETYNVVQIGETIGKQTYPTQTCHIHIAFKSVYIDIIYIAVSQCLNLVYTNLFQFDCETSNFCLCKSRSNLFLEPTSTKQCSNVVSENCLQHCLFFLFFVCTSKMICFSIESVNFDKSRTLIFFQKYSVLYKLEGVRSHVFVLCYILLNRQKACYFFLYVLGFNIYEWIIDLKT